MGRAAGEAGAGAWTPESPFHFFSLYPLLPLPPHSPLSGQVSAVVDSPLTLQGGRLEHVHPFILRQSAGGIEGSVLIFIRLLLPFFSPSST